MTVTVFSRYYDKIKVSPVCFHGGDVSLNMKKRRELKESCWLLGDERDKVPSQSVLASTVSLYWKEAPKDLTDTTKSMQTIQDRFPLIEQ